MFKNNLIAVIFSIAFAVSSGAQTKMTILLNDNSVSSFDVSYSSRAYINASTLYLYNNDSPLESYTLSKIAKIYYTNANTNSPVLNSLPFKVSPNPVKDYVTIQNLNGMAIAHVYSIDGNLRFDVQVENGSSVDCRSIPSGIYLLRINDQVTKLIKL